MKRLTNRQLNILETKINEHFSNLKDMLGQKSLYAIFSLDSWSVRDIKSGGALKLLTVSKEWTKINNAIKYFNKVIERENKGIINHNKSVKSKMRRIEETREETILKMELSSSEEALKFIENLPTLKEILK